MRFRTAVFAFTLFAAPAAAQAPAPATVPPVQQMREAVAAGDLVAARQLAGAIIREDGTDAATVEALWLIAQLHNAAGHGMRAAHALDRAADKAEAYGDPVAQARSLLEAATLYAAHHDYVAANERIARLRPLLDSPHMSAAVRAEIGSRIAG